MNESSSVTKTFFAFSITVVESIRDKKKYAFLKVCFRLVRVKEYKNCSAYYQFRRIRREYFGKRIKHFFFGNCKFDEVGISEMCEQKNSMPSLNKFKETDQKYFHNTAPWRYFDLHNTAPCRCFEYCGYTYNNICIVCRKTDYNVTLK